MLLPIGEAEPPRDQYAEVVVYAVSSKAGGLIAAVHRADRSSATTIRELADDDSIEKLDAIRSILNE